MYIAYKEWLYVDIKLDRKQLLKSVMTFFT